MKTKINRSELNDALEILSKGTTNKQTMPILTGILMETIEDKLRLFSTDLVIGIETFVDCEIIESGGLVVPDQLLKNYINKLIDDTITISTKEHKLKVESSTGKIEFPGFRADEFPTTSDYSNEPLILYQDDLKYLFDKTKFAVSQNSNETNSTLSSLKLKTENNGIITVGTNTYRLSYTKKDIDITDDLNVNLPLKTVDILSKKLLSTGEVKIYQKEGMLKFELDNYNVYSRIVQGEYPNYQIIMSTDNDIKIKVDKEELKLALERVALLNEEGVVKLNINDDFIVVNEYNAQTGNAEDYVECEKTGEDLSININSKYMIDAIKSMDNNVMIIEGADSLKPLLIKEEDSDWKYIVMPVRESSGF
ncbi:MAG: DNA polymerase III subunit beta [bacterium]